MVIRIREGARIRVAADRDGGIDVVIFLDRTKMLDSLPSGLQVYQLLGSNTGTDRYHNRFVLSVVERGTTGLIQDRFCSVWNSSVGCSTFVTESRHFRITVHD